MKIISVLITILIFSVAIGLISSAIVEHTTTQYHQETITINVQPNTLIELSKDRAESIVNITNSTNTVIPTGNYSLDTENSSIRVIDNGTSVEWGGTTWDVRYNHNDGVLAGASGVVGALVIIIIVAGFIIMLWAKSKKAGR